MTTSTGLFWGNHSPFQIATQRLERASYSKIMQATLNAHPAVSLPLLRINNQFGKNNLRSGVGNFKPGYCVNYKIGIRYEVRDIHTRPVDTTFVTRINNWGSLPADPNENPITTGQLWPRN